jgi:two-component system CheB/CheR fusion protein
MAKKRQTKKRPTPKRAPPKSIGQDGLKPTRGRGRSPKATVPSEADPEEGSSAKTPTIVGIGASAGGLEACSQLLRALPPDTGMAIVVVQHLLPTHSSALPELLAGASNIPAVQVTEGLKIEANHVYVIPPNVHMGIQGGRFHLVPRLRGAQHMPVDHFLSSLATHAGHRAIGVVLSGTASDGALGLREIKSVGGITIAQDPKTAKHDGMPRAAIATGVVDLVLSPAEIAAELAQISNHPYVGPPAPRAAAVEPNVPGDQFRRVLTLLRSATGIDFTQYKPPTIRRRLERRMVLHKIPSLTRYVRYLEGNPSEVKNLYEDILIHVTRFFRDPDVFTALAEKVFPRILKDRAPDAPVRFWIPGCSTGEDAYSLAIALLEHLGDEAGRVPLQIFATDVSDRSIEHARAGVYPDNITTDVSADRLRRYFTRVDGSWRIQKSVRDSCVFARQDVTRDPPFSRLDLILCRNLLIYLNPQLQRKIVGVCHYALKPSGFLVLGSAETIGTQAELFTLVDKKHRIYLRKGAPVLPPQEFLPLTELPALREPRPRRLPKISTTDHALGDANRLLVDRYAPPGVLIDHDMQILHLRGRSDVFLRPAPSYAEHELPRLLRDGLLHPVRSALNDVRKSERPVRKPPVQVQLDGRVVDVEVEVLPVSASRENPHFLVLFHDVSTGKVEPSTDGKSRRRGRRKPPSEPNAAESRVVGNLRQELSANREYLQSIIQDLEAANEELQSANEEVLSSNEELQSTNEELDTAKEELQSTNEELSTLNEELHGRNEELSRANSDLVNLLGSVQIAIVIVSNDLRIRRFTPMAERILNLIPGDVGRPIGHIKPNIQCPELESLILQAVDSVEATERVVVDQQGNRYSMRIRPYKDVENRIDGAVLTLFDLESIKRESTSTQVAFTEAVLATTRGFVLVLDSEHRVQAMSPALRRRMGLRDDGVHGKPVFSLAQDGWNVPALHKLLDTLSPEEDAIEDVEVELGVPGKGLKRFLVNARKARNPVDESWATVLALEEVDET